MLFRSHKILKIKPTVSQWEDFPALLAFAQKLGAHRDGCFKLVLPEGLRLPLPKTPPRNLSANCYRLFKKPYSWRLHAETRNGRFRAVASSDASLKLQATSAAAAVDKLGKMFHETDINRRRRKSRQGKGRLIPRVRYRPDVPAWTAEERLSVGIPTWSPIHPLRGDQLDHTKDVIPGIHTPYAYESSATFGAVFQMHVEDYKLLSLNHLYKGRKVWIVVPCTAFATAEKALRRRQRCSQFMRHRAEFVFPHQLERLGIPYRMVDQWPGETMVILPEAYHEGFSTGYSLAEAKNYADDSWSTDEYQPCGAGCGQATAIPAECMRMREPGDPTW